MTGRQGMKNTTDLFLCLIRAGLWGRIPEPALFEKADWDGIFRLADVQTVTPVLLDGVALLPKSTHPPLAVKMRKIGEMQQVERTNMLHLRVMGKIHRALADRGIADVYMKGQVTAMRYPAPLHRQPGDIDFVVGGEDFPAVLQALSEMGKVDAGMVHEHHGMAWIDGVAVEPHYKVHNFQRPSTDKAMQAMFYEVFPQQTVTVDMDGCSMPVFPPTFESVFLISHMVNHVYEEGLGMRQVIDYAMFLNRCGNDIDVRKHDEWLGRMRMRRAWRIFTCVCVEYLGLRMPAFVAPFTGKEKSMAGRAFADVLRVGNFGRGKYVFRHNGTIDAIRNYGWVVRRCLSMGFVCPSEARWWIVSKVRRFFWKKRKQKHGKMAGNMV